MAGLDEGVAGDAKVIGHTADFTGTVEGDWHETTNDFCYVMVVEYLDDGTYRYNVTDKVVHWVAFDNDSFDLDTWSKPVPLPEPTALALLALGVAGVALRRKVAA